MLADDDDADFAMLAAAEGVEDFFILPTDSPEPTPPFSAEFIL